jgi:hypothetical protein
MAEARVRATSVPERAENCGYQRSATSTSNGLHLGKHRVTRCVKRPSQQPVAPGLRRVVDRGASYSPAGLTARTRPTASPDRAANLCSSDCLGGTG